MGKRIWQIVLALVIVASLTIPPVVAQGPDRSVQITWPPPVYVVSGAFSIYGTANVAGMAGYYLEFRMLPADPAASPDAGWLPATLPVARPVVKDLLGTWDTSAVPDGLYELRLTVSVGNQETVHAVVSPLRVKNHPSVYEESEPAAAAAAPPTEQPAPTEEPVQEAEAVAVEEPVEVEAVPAGLPNLYDTLAANALTTSSTLLFDLAGTSGRLREPGPYTIFAPSENALYSLAPDVLNALLSDPAMLVAVTQYHVVPGRVTRADLLARGSGSLDTLTGVPLRFRVESDGSITINGTMRLVATDIQASNGVVHVLEGVLIPPAFEEAAVEEMPVEATEEPMVEEEPVAEATEEPMAEAAPVETAAVDIPGNLITCSAANLSGLRIGLVTDIGRINDNSFNQKAWEGVLAAENCGATVNFIETQDYTEYLDNIIVFAEDDHNIIVTVGFALGEATLDAAAMYPDITFIGVDQYQNEPRDNVIGLLFYEDRAGFLAGALAAYLTQSDVVAAVLGTDLVPPVVAFKEGFEAGAIYVNPDIGIISTYHPGGLDVAFTDPEWGAAVAAQAIDQGADVIFAAGGWTGNGALVEAAARATQRGGAPPFCIGVDTDQWHTVPEAHPCLVSSAIKQIDVGVAQIITDIANGQARGGNTFGTVALAPFHDLAVAVRPDIRDALQGLTDEVNRGAIWTGYGTPPTEAEAPAEEAEPMAEAAEEPMAEAMEEPMAEAVEEPAAEEEAAPLSPFASPIRIATSAGWPPYEMLNDDGELYGFDIELMQAIATDQGFEIEFINMTFDSLFVGLEAGEYDAIISAVTITPERLERVDFSNRYFHAAQVVVVKADSTAVSPDDLAGLRVGVQRGTTAEFTVEDIEGVEVWAFDEVLTAFEALSNGDVAAVVADGPLANGLIAANPQLGLKILQAHFVDEFYGIAVRPGYPDLLSAVNAGLANKIADGTYAALHEKWFGAPPTAEFLPPTSATVPSLGVVTIGTNAEYLPFEFVDTNGDIVGFDIDLTQAIAERAGFEIEWVNTRWSGIFVALASGEFDAVSSAATITAEREEIVDFSNPVFNNGQAIAVRQPDAATITGAAALAGLRVGVQAGTTGDILVSELAGVEVVRYDEITLAFQALAAGDVDAVVGDMAVAADIIAKNPKLNAVITGEPLSMEYYGIAVNSAHPKLLAAINDGLAQIIADGTYAEIYLKWFGVPPPSEFMPPTSAEVPSRGVLTVGTSAEWPPFEFVDEDGNIVGFDVDLMNAIAARTGYELEWVNTRWDGIFVALAAGEFDVLASGTTITAEREEVVDFSAPYINTGTVIVAHAANSLLMTSLSDLNNQRIGVIQDTPGDQLARQVSGATITRYDYGQEDAMFQAVANRELDVALPALVQAADYIRTHPDAALLITSAPLSDEWYGFAVPPGQADTLAAINDGLAQVIADGTYAELYVKWFGTPPPVEFLPAGE